MAKAANRWALARREKWGYWVNPYLILALRLFVGGILVYAGWVKVFDMPGMADGIENYRMLPVAVVNLFGIVLPVLELTVGLCLILGFFMDGALAIATGLFLVFIVAVQAALLRGLDIECGCFGTIDSGVVSLQHLILDVIFLLATLPIWIARVYGAPAEDLGPQVEAGAGDGA